MARMRGPLPLAPLVLLSLGCGARTPLAPPAFPPDAAPDVVALDVAEEPPPPPPDGPALDDGPTFDDGPTLDDGPAPDDGPLPACVPATFSLRARPSELVFVVDRSGSFASTWGAVIGAFTGAIPAIDGRVATGLLLYPDQSCTVASSLHVPIAVGNGAAILSAVSETRPVGRTPTRVAVRTALAALRARGNGAAGYLLLVTDGVPTCPEVGDGGDRDVEGTVAAVRESAAAGVPVFVIGVAVSDSTALDAVAVAGGRPTRDAMGRRYYAVDSAEGGLLGALRDVQASVTRCELAVAAPPAGATLRVTFRGEPVAEDAARTDGWWWSDATRTAITLHGPACRRVVEQSGDLTATIACPER